VPIDRSNAVNKKITLAVLMLVCAAVAVWYFFLRSQPGSPIRNVVLISIDTCRADYLGCYGFPRRITPNIDAVAGEGVLFENVISPVPITLPSHASILTGTTPLYHQAHDNSNYYVSAYNKNLAQILSEQDYTTGAIVSAVVLGAEFGLNRGFETYDDHFEQTIKGVVPVERNGTAASRLAVEWLDKNRDKKFFLFLHYYDPHLPYEPPPPFDSLFRDNLYAGEIAYTDYCIGLVIDKLKQLRLYDSTLLIITADHGEMLGEHQEKTHAYFIYQSALKVPLIFRPPGGRRPARVGRTVGLIDIAPTVCGLLGVEIPKVMQGKDLSDYIKRRWAAGAERYMYCESILPTIYGCNPLVGVVAGQWKYILTTRPELYNLADDPNERHNLAQAELGRANLLHEQLGQMLNELAYKDGAGSRVAADEQTIKRLQTLGYIAGGGEDDSFQFDPKKQDPKDLADFHNDCAQANGAINNKLFEKAKVLCQKMLARKPDFAMTYAYLGQIAFEQGDRHEGFAQYYRYLDMVDPNWRNMNRPTDVYAELARKYFYLQKAHSDLGAAYFQDGKYDQAVAHYEQSLRLAPQQSNMRNNLALALKKQGHFDQAIAQLEEVLRADPALAEAHYNLAEMLETQERLDEAVFHFEESLRLNHALRPGVYYYLGDVCLKRSQTAKAVEYWTEALRLQPDWEQLLDRLALLYAADINELRNPDKAIGLAQKACELSQYKSPVRLRTLAIAYAAAGRFAEAVETTKEAIELAREAGNDKLLEDLEKKLDLYLKEQVR